jgi:hypothetical protein
MEPTAAGGAIIVGSVINSSKADIWLVHIDAAGNLVWQNTFGGADDDFGYAVRQLADGNFMIVGKTASYGAGETDLWLIKTDQNGQKIWDKVYGYINEEIGQDLLETPEGDVIIVGSTERDENGKAGIWSLKVDPLGNRLWTANLGGSSTAQATNIARTFDGGYIVSGFSAYSSAQYNLGTLLLKINPNGLVLPQQDGDNDQIYDLYDHCPTISDSSLRDNDRDGLGNVCDTCPDTPNSDQKDTDGDKIGDLCEAK